jgi:hypothetical protein
MLTSPGFPSFLSRTFWPGLLSELKRTWWINSSIPARNASRDYCCSWQILAKKQGPSRSTRMMLVFSSRMTMHSVIAVPSICAVAGRPGTPRRRTRPFFAGEAKSAEGKFVVLDAGDMLNDAVAVRLSPCADAEGKCVRVFSAFFTAISLCP